MEVEVCHRAELDDSIRTQRTTVENHTVCWCDIPLTRIQDRIRYKVSNICFCSQMCVCVIM